jgi:hypothetical protein
MNTKLNQPNNLPLRHEYNKTLILNYDNKFNGLSVMNQRGALVDQYLTKLNEVILLTLNHYMKVFAMRVDLRFSNDHDIAQLTDTGVITRFIDSFKAKIAHNRMLAKRNGNYQDTVVRYIWAKEISSDGGVHYHVMLFLNGNAYRAVGDFSFDSDNMFSRINGAWASALGINLCQVKGLVHFSHSVFIDQSQAGAQHKINDLFFAASYLCKAETKIYNDGGKWFGSSRS